MSGPCPSGAPTVGHMKRRRERTHAHLTRHQVRWNLALAALGIAFVVFELVVEEDSDLALIVGSVVVGIFLGEWLLRFWAAPCRKTHFRRHWFDLAITIPLVGGLRFARVIRILRIPSIARTALHIAHIGHHGKHGAESRREQGAVTRI